MKISTTAGAPLPAADTPDLEKILFSRAGLIAARKTHGRPDLFEDARQEGLIAGWEALQARPDAPLDYLVGAVRNGVLGVVSGRRPTGSQGRRGWQDAHAVAGPLVVDEDDEDSAAHLEDETAAEALEAAEVDAHRAEILAAVAGLDPADRDLVAARFWREERWPSEAARRRWHREIRPALAARLGHLADVA